MHDAIGVTAGSRGCDYSGIHQVYVPVVGLADGLVHILYDKYKTAQRVETEGH